MTLATDTATWLSENVDSHGIYGTDILDTLPAGITYHPINDTLEASGRSVKLHSMPADAFEKAYGAVRNDNPKGAYLDPDIAPATRLVGGYVLASRLDTLLTGEDAGGRFNGRGFAFRANVEHLRESV